MDDANCSRKGRSARNSLKGCGQCEIKNKKKKNCYMPLMMKVCTTEACLMWLTFMLLLQDDGEVHDVLMLILLRGMHDVASLL